MYFNKSSTIFSAEPSTINNTALFKKLWVVRPSKSLQIALVYPQYYPLVSALTCKKKKIT